MFFDSCEASEAPIEVIVSEKPSLTTPSPPSRPRSGLKGKSDQDEINFDEITVIEEEQVDNLSCQADELKRDPEPSPQSRPTIPTDALERMELRRALHRAGLDSTTILNKSFNNNPRSTTADIYDYMKSGLTVVPMGSRVKETLAQMMAMGYSDDDGWLTQLITEKRGNLEEVLDVLAPVQRGREL